MIFNKNNEGNALMIALFFVVAILVIFFFMGAMFVSEASSIAYNIKLDMYSINKSAIVAVNKGMTSRNGFSYDIKTYKNQMIDLLKRNYGLDDNLESKGGIVQKVKILEYDIIKKGKKDNYTNTKVGNGTLHSVVEVKLKPIFNIKILEDVCTFKIHEDVVLNELITEGKSSSLFDNLRER